MGEEENELEGGVYGGDNFVNNVSASKVLTSLTFSSFKLSFFHPKTLQASLTLPPFSHPATNLGRVLVDDQVDPNTIC